MLEPLFSPIAETNPSPTGSATRAKTWGRSLTLQNLPRRPGRERRNRHDQIDLLGGQGIREQLRGPVRLSFRVENREFYVLAVLIAQTQKAFAHPGRRRL